MSSIILMGWILKPLITLHSALLKVANACPNYTPFCKRGREVTFLPKFKKTARNCDRFGVDPKAGECLSPSITGKK